MKIELKEISVRELTNGFQDKGDDGVIGYGGLLDIRPPYQREFIYKDKQREAVIDTINKNFPLNVMYWAVRDGGGFEVIDGQQRTISICQYLEGDFSLDGRFFHNLQKVNLSDLEFHICLIKKKAPGSNVSVEFVELENLWLLFWVSSEK